ncbi:MAG: tRNA (adenosine(37)-N6)-dimethylallyltransferase MiaA [Clostridia bacterium]|nr:tRNA (adenosine(37)-N6)-dimethylallyltransferase MiaA [Clostridia bacterium]
MKTFLGITGTTCVGKSEVAVELAKLLNTQVISSDSMQIYKVIDIGTAKITKQEMDGIAHWMLDIVEPNQDYSAHLYQQQASKIINNMDCVPIVAGGTGLYFQSLVYPPEFGCVSNEMREELKDLLKEKGLSYLQELLKQLDKDSYSSIDLCNPVRVIRAIEIAKSGGALRSQGKGNVNPQFNCLLFVLETDRSVLYDKINQRVDKMMDKGLLQEVKCLVDKYGYCQTSAFNAIGYKEIIEYLKGNCTLEEAVEQIKINSRHYAKRQITYFKKLKVSQFVNVDNLSSKQVAQHIYQQIVDKINQ